MASKGEKRFVLNGPVSTRGVERNILCGARGRGSVG